MCLKRQPKNKITEKKTCQSLELYRLQVYIKKMTAAYIPTSIKYRKKLIEW